MQLALLFTLAALQAPDAILDRFPGEWTSKEEATRPDGSKLAFTLDGKYRRIFQGKAILMEETLNLPGGRKSENLIVLRFDAVAKKYRAVWQTDGGPEPLTFTGTATADALSLVDDKGNLKIEYQFVKDGFFKAQLLAKQGEGWRIATVAEYTRTAKPAEVK